MPSRTGRRWLVGATAIGVMAAGVLGWQADDAATEAIATPRATVPTVTMPTGVVVGQVPPSVRQALAELPVKGRAPKTGYARARFGKAWDDDVDVELGHNRCSTREDILRRDLTAEVINPDGCRVMSGLLADPYSGTTVPFIRGRATSALVQIDHVVALSDAWQKGAQQWTTAKRRDFANDPRNLQAVQGSVNQQKGSGDAATWLPPATAYRCTYVTRQIEVKRRYGLWVTTAERDAMTRVLNGCGTR